MLLVASLLTPATRAQETSNGSDFLVTNVRVFDGARLRQQTYVAVSQGTIRAIGGNISEWQHLRAIDGTGSTLLPGFIDAHAHVRDQRDLRQTLALGVTTVLDMGATVSPQALFALRSQARTAPDIADLRSAGYFARRVSVPDPRVSVDVPSVSTLEEAKAFVANRHAEAADYLKIVLTGVRTAQSGRPNLDESLVRALVDTAHSSGMLAIAHVETTDDVEIAVSAGIDGLAHVWREGGPRADLARRLADRHVFVAATLAVADGFRSDGGRARLLADPRLRNIMSDAMQRQLSASVSPPANAAPGNDSSDNAMRAALKTQQAIVRSLRNAGVRLVAGTDAATGMSTIHGISLHRELELLTAAGLTPSEALSAATLNVADAFRLSDRGRIAVGRRADLVLVRGDPTSDILASRDLVRIWKSGIEVDRRLLDQ